MAGLTLAFRLREYAISQAHLGEYLGVTSSTVSNWVSGHGSPVSVENKLRIETFLREREIPLEGIWEPRIGHANLVEWGSALAVPPPRGWARADVMAEQWEPRRTPETQPKLKEQTFMATRETLYPHELEHFGLTNDPFENAFDPEQIWMGPQQQVIQRKIINAVRYHQVLAVVGEVGSGKSSLLRSFLSRWQRNNKVRVLTPETLDRKGMTEGAIASAIIRGLAPGAHMRASLEDRSLQVRQLLEQANREQTYPVLVIEEAHDLTPPAFIALKRVWDTMSLFKQLGIILVGQGTPIPSGERPTDWTGDLGRRLRYDHRIRELGQRTVVAHIGPMTREEVGAYIAHRFVTAKEKGKEARIFDTSALQLLSSEPWRAYPLPLGNLCVLAMRKAVDVADDQVTAEHVRLALNN